MLRVEKTRIDHGKKNLMDAFGLSEEEKRRLMKYVTEKVVEAMLWDEPISKKLVEIAEDENLDEYVKVLASFMFCQALNMLREARQPPILLVPFTDMAKDQDRNEEQVEKSQVQNTPSIEQNARSVKAYHT